jgi:DMSO/TMAO reductase YedYZ molybdopterin-dependent catalytic subunit
MPAHSQITHQDCEEGWSFIAQWSGVPLSSVLGLVGVSAEAKYVAVFALDESWDSLDLPEAFHPQTYLAYNLNGQEIFADHGAPLRLRTVRQLGYKSVKSLSRIAVTDSMKNIGNGKGSISSDYSYSWYASN